MLLLPLVLGQVYIHLFCILDLILLKLLLLPQIVVMSLRWSLLDGLLVILETARVQILILSIWWSTYWNFRHFACCAIIELSLGIRNCFRWDPSLLHFVQSCRNKGGVEENEWLGIGSNIIRRREEKDIKLEEGTSSFKWVNRGNFSIEEKGKEDINGQSKDSNIRQYVKIWFLHHTSLCINS